jgi:putative DNA primase/helicase
MAKHRMYTPIDEFDTKPLCVNTPNTLLSFEHLDKESEVPHFSDHNSAMNITKITASPWTMGAPANRWNAFLEEIIPSADVREYLQRAAGYSILGLTREQCFFICYGSGLNGKSTFLSVLLKVLGPDYSAQVGAETFMQQRNDRIRADLARLRGMRLVSAVETAENRRLDEALVKSCTGGDPIVAEHKFKEPFQFYPQFTLWLATNHKPRVLDTSYAMWRRVRLIPFTQTIPVDKVDPDLESKLLQEREGIMDWVVTGAVHYLRDGLKPPEEVTAASESYRKEEDTLGQFFDDRCTAAPAAQISRSDLYVAYKEWAESNGERPLGQRQFSHLCQERGFDSYKAHGIRYWVGLEVNP